MLNVRVSKGAQVREEILERIFDKIVSTVCESRESIKSSFLESILIFLTLIRATDLTEASTNFFDDHFLGLPMCLRFSATTIKRLLLDHSDDAQLLKTWAVLAKRAKDYYESEECRFFHNLYELCFASKLT